MLLKNVFLDTLYETQKIAVLLLRKDKKKKYRIRETKHLSTDADSSTNTTVGWTKKTQKPKFFEKRKKSSKMQQLKNV